MTISLDSPIINGEQIATGYGHIFDLLLGAYVQIAEALPRFDRFQEVFGHDSKFQIVLGMVYTDILEFHRHAYKIFKRPGMSNSIAHVGPPLQLISMVPYFPFFVEGL